MISKEQEYVLAIALANERIASEIASRLIDESADPAAAQAILDIVSDSKEEKKEIKEYLTVALANKKAAKEICDQLDLIIECLEYQAEDIVANNAALNEAQAKIQEISKSTEEILVVALANRKIAKDIKKAIDDAGEVVKAIADATI